MKDQLEPRWSDHDKKLFSDCIQTGMICFAFVLAVTGSVSIYTTHKYEVAKLSFQLATRTSK